MRTWDLALHLDPRGPRPIFVQIAHGVVEAIRDRRLAPGDPLPGSRVMADRLGVHRNTVLAAISELRAQGWLETRPGGGTWVRRELSEGVAAPHRTGRGLGFSLPDVRIEAESVPAPSKDLLSLGTGTPDLRLIPAEDLARAIRRAMRSRRSAALAYADPRGHAGLVDALRRLLATMRGATVDSDGLMVTRGAQQALDLVVRAAIRPGDRVAVEALGYRPAHTALRLAGAVLVPIPVDGEGMSVGRLAAESPVRAIYVTPHHQYPTTVTLSAARRVALLDLAVQKRILVIEDDYDHEFHYEGRPVLPLLAADRGGVVAYVGTMSKVLAPGLRVGFLAGPPALIERAVRIRAVSDRQGDQIIEAAVAELADDGTLIRHFRKMRAVYHERRDHFADALRRRMGGSVQFDLPPGGIGLWARIDPAVDVVAWQARCEAAGVWFRDGSRFTLDPGDPVPNAARLGFAALDPSEIERAVGILAGALNAGGGRRVG